MAKGKTHVSNAQVNKLVREHISEFINAMPAKERKKLFWVGGSNWSDKRPSGVRRLSYSSSKWPAVGPARDLFLDGIRKDLKAMGAEVTDINWHLAHSDANGGGGYHYTKLVILRPVGY